MGSESHHPHFNLWPENETRRQKQIESLTRILCSVDFDTNGKPSFMSQEEARVKAKMIERECIAAADELFMKEPHGDGNALRLYTTKAGRMMWEVLESKRTVYDDTIVTDSPLEPVDNLFDISCANVCIIGAYGARVLLEPLAKQGKLYKRLCFRNRSFGLDAANVARPVLESIKKQITKLDISGFVAGRREDEALNVIRIFSKALEGSVLRYLNLSDIALGEKGIWALKELLNSQENLEELYLMNNGMSAEAVKVLSEVILSTGNLKVLHFHNNLIGDEGATSIAEMVKRSPKLESFRCSATRMSSVGVITLAEALGACTHLEKLDLSDNLYCISVVMDIRASLAKISELTEQLYLNKQRLLKQLVLPSLAECATVVQSLKKLTLVENELNADSEIVIAKKLEDVYNDMKNLSVSSNMSPKVQCFASAASKRSGLVQVSANGNFCSNYGIDEMTKNMNDGENSLKDVLIPLDENEQEDENEGDGEGWIHVKL